MSLESNEGNFLSFILSLGFNWWLTGYLNLSLNYRHTMHDRFDEKGTSDGVNVRLLLVLE